MEASSRLDARGLGATPVGDLSALCEDGADVDVCDEEVGVLGGAREVGGGGEADAAVVEVYGSWSAVGCEQDTVTGL